MNLNRIALFLLGLILVIAFVLRLDNLYTWPRKGATFDEYAWTWQGINLIKEKVPISWSPHPQYKEKKLVIYQETAFYVVKPYLEHPPLFGMLAGSYAILNGVSNMYDLDIKDIRGLALLLGVASVFILYFFLKEAYDSKTAILGSLLYATVPSVVIGSRLVQNENFFIPLWLLALFFILKFIKTERTLFRNLAAVLCGLLVLAKIPWAAAGFSIVLIFLFLKRYKDVYKFLLVVAPIALLYFLYGFYYDRDLFLSLWGLQLNRYDLYFNSIYAIFQKPYLTDRFYTDGWIFFGWLTIFLLFLKDFKKNIFLILPFLSYFLVFLSAIPDEAGHGWYRYPFFPFLVASTAIFLREHFAKNFLMTFFLLVFVGTSLLELTWASVFGFSYPFFRIAILTWLLVLLPYFFNDKKFLKLAKISSFLWLGAFILLNIWAVFLYTEQ